MRNFHGWMYRRFVIGNIENPRGGQYKPEGQGVSLVEQEFAYTIKMVQGVGGMSNYSAWHNRSKLIPRLLKERKYGEQQRMDFLEDGLFPHPIGRSVRLNWYWDRARVTQAEYLNESTRPVPLVLPSLADIF